MFHCNYIMARCRLWSRLFEWSRLFDLVKQIVWCQWWDAMVVQTESDPFWWRHAWLPPPLRHQYQISSYNNWAIYMHMLNMMQATTIHIFISAGTCIYIYIYLQFCYLFRCLSIYSFLQGIVFRWLFIYIPFCRECMSLLIFFHILLENINSEY